MAYGMWKSTFKRALVCQQPVNGSSLIMMNWQVSLWTFFNTSFSIQRREQLREMERRYRRTYFYYYYYY